MRIASVVVVALVFAASSALAGDEREKSRAAFDAGARALEEGRPKEALASFREAYRLYPHYATWYNVGLCERALGHPVEAVDAFQAYLDGAGAEITSDRVDRVAALIQESQRKIATIDVDVDPPSAAVTIDGAALAERRRVRVDPGEHVVEATAPDRAKATRTFSVEAGGGAAVSLALPPAPRRASRSSTEGAGSPPRDAPAPRGPVLDAAFWATASAAGVAAIAGAACGAVALSDSRAYADPATSDAAAADHRSRGEVLRVVADVSFGVAIASAAGAVLLATVRTPKGKVVVAGTSVAWRVRF